ncbi:uncharacterized protein [Spinacia oleracea]|uniref:RNase H type-1 domain-containing protein n=1 Tax=Spinacia oleracea TaxID=3562 RepID=A0ABM3QSI5_SPIOL|nr:uncharacterized protein LOC130462033 [Spinacia oleracea]
MLRRNSEENVPQKVKNLVWRAVSNSLPTMSLLASRGMSVDPRCPRCGEAMETILHMVLQCSESKLIWLLSPARISDGVALEGGSFSEWCLDMSKKCKMARSWEIVMMFVCQIWNLRNLWTYERRKMDPMLARHRTLQLLGEYEVALERKQPVSPPVELTPTSWQPPSAATFKLNTDAAVRDNKTGLGMVVRDGVGDVLMSAGLCTDVCCSVLQVEAEAVRFGLKYSLDAGMRSLEVESDCLPVVQLLRMKKRERSPAQMIVDDILSMASNFDYCEFIFANRSCNKVSHAIANSSLSFSEVRVWMEEHPADVLPLVTADKNFLYQ